MSLDYKVLEKKSSEMFQLIDDAQETLKKADVTFRPFSNFVSDETRKQLNNCVVKMSKVPPEKLLDGAGALAAAAVANPAIALTVLGVGVAVESVLCIADVYQDKKAKKEARKVLEQAFKCLEVYLGQMNELLNQKMKELMKVFLFNSQRRQELQSEIKDLKEQILKTRSFVNGVRN